MGAGILGSQPRCTCAECQAIHQDFYNAFGCWPNVTHTEAQELKERRARREKRWSRLFEA